MEHQTQGLWRPLSLFFLDIEPAANNSEICHTEYLQNMRVQIEPPYQKQINIPQCKRCQTYFHTKGYCARRPRCVKCGKPHSTEQCTLPKTRAVICLHCRESHPASYRGCKSTKKSYAQDFLLPVQQQVFILQIHRDKRMKALQHHRKLKDDRK